LKVVTTSDITKGAVLEVNRLGFGPGKG